MDWDSRDGTSRGADVPSRLRQPTSLDGSLAYNLGQHRDSTKEDAPHYAQVFELSSALHDLRLHYRRRCFDRIHCQPAYGEWLLVVAVTERAVGVRTPDHRFAAQRRARHAGAVRAKITAAALSTATASSTF